MMVLQLREVEAGAVIWCMEMWACLISCILMLRLQDFNRIGKNNITHPQRDRTRSGPDGGMDVGGGRGQGVARGVKVGSAGEGKEGM